MWLFAVIAMLCWSGSDIFSKIGSPQHEKTSHFKVGIAVGGIMGLHALYMIFIEKIPFSLMDIVHYLPASFFYIVSMVVGYVGLRYIELSISSPICNGSGAVSAILCMILFGITFNPESESNAVYLNGWIIAGLALVIGGILLLGIVDNTEDPELRALRQEKANRKYTKSLWAILLPVLYCILDSLGTFVDTIIAEGYVERIGNEDLAGDVMNTAYELTWMIIAIIFAIYVFGIKKEKISKKFDGVKLLGGTCETIGQIFYAKVVVSGYIPGLVIISAYCLVSMVWSAIFLKEKLSKKHYLCLAAAIIGILVLGYFDV